MDWEGKVESSKLLCAATGQPLAPGAVFFSALVFQDGLFQRRDFSAEAWSAQDQDAFISWWRQKAPGLDEGSKPRAINSEALLRIFAALKESTQRSEQCFVYIVVLFLMRARKLRYRDSVRDGDHPAILVEDRANQVVYRVRDPQMTPEEERTVQENLLEVVELGAGPGNETGQ